MIVTTRLRVLIDDLEQAAIDWQDAQEQESSVRIYAGNALNYAREKLIKELEAAP